ncbi:TPA: hypothetical protein IAB29_04070 [Candidatus Ventrenecus stercoripullorum]|nr:hypothetical protein [Candidatus Ventrenecus stercoripullorum]
MSYVYHGSHTSGLKKLIPHKSTHGNYVYATEDKTLPVIFSGVAGDDLVYSLFRQNTEPWQLVERVPECFSVIYNTSASVYTLESDSFKDIHTGFTEVVSETAVDVVQEEKIPNVYQELERLEKEGLIQIYHYPKRPESIPKDDLDLLERTIEYTKMNNGSVNKLTFERLLYLHPNLLKKVNETLSDMGELTYQKEELTDIFEKFIFKQMTNPEKEYFLKSSMLQISTTYPNLTNSLKQKMEIFSKSKEEKVERLITLLSNSLENNPEVFKMQMQSLYLKDPRSLKEISREILEKYQLTKATKEPNILK